MASLQVVFFVLALSCLYEAEAKYKKPIGSEYYRPLPPHQLPKKPTTCNEFDHTLVNLVVDSGKALIKKLCESSIRVCDEHNMVAPGGMLRAVTQQGCMEVRRTCDKLANQLDLTGSEQVTKKRPFRPKKPIMIDEMPFNVPKPSDYYKRPQHGRPIRPQLKPHPFLLMALSGRDGLN